jgi:hypothetical protein
MHTRREALTGAAACAMLALRAPTQALATRTEPLAFQPSALLLEFRRLATRVCAIECVDPLEPFYALDGVRFESIEPLLEDATNQHRAAIAAYMPDLSSISRTIWSKPAAAWEDIVARAELAKFWKRNGLGYEDHHGYDNAFADMRLIDDVLAVAEARPKLGGVAPFDAPTKLIEWRRLDEERTQMFSVRDWTDEEQTESMRRQCRLESALVDGNPASCWSDIVIRAELTSWRRRGSLEGCCWIRLDAEDDHSRFCDQRSFAELLTAILRLGNCPPLADVDDICRRRTARARTGASDSLQPRG